MGDAQPTRLDGLGAPDPIAGVGHRSIGGAASWRWGYFPHRSHSAWCRRFISLRPRFPLRPGRGTYGYAAARPAIRSGQGRICPVYRSRAGGGARWRRISTQRQLRPRPVRTHTIRRWFWLDGSKGASIDAFSVHGVAPLVFLKIDQDLGLHGVSPIKVLPVVMYSAVRQAHDPPG
jgi:hypothetical protein